MYHYISMTPSHLTDVLKTERSAYSHPWTEGNFRNCIASGYDCKLMLQAQDSNRLCGYFVMYVAVGEAHLLNLCVAPEFQKRGLAHQMLTEMNRIALGQGAETFFLEVRESNTRAIEIYSCAGFNEVGLRKNYYPAAQGREHAIIMAKSLVE
ncbi:MAG: ribosomal protein S18-alanine N-acetyltransferase [Pseudomonadales bacterium]|nr:ribosomal protein S18-alanine N-acetyltransferase [Pseudomonadales bacterium]